MMRTLVWKEYREHRIIWLVLMAVNSGTLLALPYFDQTGILGVGRGKLEVLGPAAVLLAWAYGMICGSMLLAGEREEATLSFLDTLPTTRLRLWLGKVQIGLFLLVGQILVLFGWLVGLRAIEGPYLFDGADASPSLLPYIGAMLLFGTIGLIYGLFFSARGENVLYAIGLAVLSQFLAASAAAFLALIIDVIWHEVLVDWLNLRRNIVPMSQGEFEGTLIVVICGGLTLAALAGSARIFSQLDHLRLPATVRRMRSRASVVTSWLRLLWLCGRQMQRLAVIVLAVALGLGVLFLVAGPLLWPVVTLLLGVLCGVSVFSDEQTSGSFRFLGEQRLPLGSIWVIKTGSRFALLLLAALLLLVPSLLVAVYHHSEERFTDARLLRVVAETMHLRVIVAVVPLLPYLTIGLLYGFSAGLLCGLLSRKSIVSAMIALMTSSGLAIVWVPSMAGIGLPLWLIAGPPLILLAMAALLVRPWAANRLASWGTYLRVSAAMAASLVWIVCALWYRVVEVPDVPEPFDVAAYKASLPSRDDDKTGQLIRSEWGAVEKAMRGFRDQHPGKSLSSQCSDVLKDGWPEGNLELGQWLDQAFAKDWLKPLAPLPEMPLGMVADPRLLTLRDDRELAKWSLVENLSMVMAARGLQQQARGDPAVFLDHMRIALALSRNVHHHMPSFSGMFIIDLQARTWQAAVDPWLEKLRGRPDLLKRALQTLIAHEKQKPGEEEQFQADYVLLQNTLMQTPENLLENAIPHRDKKDQDKKDDESRAAELRMVTTLWFFPWEQQRHQRILRVLFAGTEGERRKVREWGGDVFAPFGLFTRSFREGRSNQVRLSERMLADFRACQLKVALRLYQEENGQLPANLEALVHRGYLPSVPRDPLAQGQQLFHYRRSSGEWIEWSINRDDPTLSSEIPAQVPVMPRADGPGRAAVQRGGGAMPLPGAGMPDRDDEAAAMRERPFMPHADEPAFPPPGMMVRPAGPGIALPPAAARAGGGGLLPPARFFPKGQGILWSVGPDGQDNGGKAQDDLIYPVPPPPR